MASAVPQTVTPESVGLSGHRLRRVTTWLEEQVSSNRLAGASCLIGRSGQVAYFESTGQRDNERNLPFEKDSIVRIYSMTKPVTSVAAMMCYEDGCFQLDDPVSLYIPAFANLTVWTGGGDASHTTPLAQPMLVRHLLTHTSGLTYGFMNTNVIDALYRSNDLGQPTNHPDLASWVDALAGIPLICQPGSQWNYSVSTDVLGRLVEIWSGQTLEDFLEDRIFAPLGMADTGFHVPAGKVDRFATLYAPAVGGALGQTDGPPLAERGGLKIQEPFDTSTYLSPTTFFSGGGGLVSTMQDYSLFCQMLMNGGELNGQRLLSPTTVRYMRTNQLPDNRDMAAMGQPVWSETSYDGIGFGLGFAVVLDPVKASIITSPGEHHWGGAASTFFWLDPVEDLYVIFLTQLLPSSTYPIRRELRVRVYQSLVESFA